MQNAQNEKTLCMQKRESKTEYDKGYYVQKFQGFSKKTLRQRRAKTDCGGKDQTASLNKNPNLKNSEF